MLAIVFEVLLLGVFVGGVFGPVGRLLSRAGGKALKGWPLLAALPLTAWVMLELWSQGQDPSPANKMAAMAIVASLTAGFASQLGAKGRESADD